jgi:hypothetical protein
MKKAWLIWTLLLLSILAGAQSYHTGSKRAVKKFEEALSLYRSMDPAGAEEALLQAIRADEGFIEAYHLLSQLCYDTGRLKEAIDYYARSLEIDPEGNPEGYRLLAGLFLKNGEYERALDLVGQYLSFSPEVRVDREAAMAIREKCLFARSALEHPVPFLPENLGDSVNSALNEYWPCLSVDEQLLMFTVMLPLTREHPEAPVYLQEDFFYSVRLREGWSLRKNAGPPLNTQDNEGAHSMTADGQILFFTACNRRDGQGQCDIYVSNRKGNSWSIPVNLGPPVNSRYSEKHPTVSADGRILLFTSDRPGGKGSFDIWMSVRNATGWSLPVNLGDSVNTAGTEQSPFLHPDGQSLYFSSTGWPGMGESDIFLSRKGADGSWKKPVNLGYPINTYHDEIGLTVNASGNRAYFASDRERGTDTDLYTFELPVDKQPVTVSYLSGRVYDARNMKGLRALIRLIDLETEEVIVEIPSTGEEGDYLVPLPGGRDYALNVSAEGYLFHSGHFSLKGQYSRIEPYRLDIPLERIHVGSSVVLYNIFFDTDSHALLPSSLAELNRVLLFLEENPAISVEISGHTDSTGSTGYNQELSEKRAAAVRDYLVGQGIGASRLKATGYGASLPLADNETEEGRAQNRRTELKITEAKR